MKPDRTTLGWIRSAQAQTGASWYAAADRGLSRTAVLIVPGIAHEERTMADGLHALARALADCGLGSLLIDLHGTAQSSGSLAAPDIGNRWREDVRGGVRCLHEAGFEHVVVIGVRLGALIAAHALGGQSVAGFVAWAPVASGRRYARELKMLQSAAIDVSTPEPTLSIAGHEIPPSLLAVLAKLEMTSLAPPAPTRVLLLEDAQQAAASWGEALVAAGHAVDRRSTTQSQRWLFSPNDIPIVPGDDMRRVRDWVRALAAAVPDACSAGPVPRLHLTTEITFECEGRTVRERAIRIEPAGLSAIVSEPADGPSMGAARLLATLVGPGRMFPELARSEAAHGKTCLRFDFAGFSTSRRRADGSGGELYALGNRQDVAAALEYLRQARHGEVVMTGFCAGGWSMLHAGKLPGVAGLIGINIALYRQPDYLTSELVARSGHPASKALALLRRVGLLARHVDALERRARIALDPCRWLRKLLDSDAHLLLVYGAKDLGLIHLKRQLGHRLDAFLDARGLRLGVHAGLGHLTEGVAARAEALNGIRAFLSELDLRVGAVGAARPDAQTAAS